MKKIASLLLVFLVSFSLFAVPSSSLALVTAIDQANIIYFDDGTNSITEVNFTSTNTAAISVALWTNKAISSTVKLPQVRLEATPMVHDTVTSSFIQYSVKGTTVTNSKVTITEDLYAGSIMNAATAAHTYYADLVIELDAQSKADALSGNYLGSLTVTVIAD